MRILIISTFFPPLNSIASLRPYSWAKYWTLEGHDVTVLTTQKQQDPSVMLYLPNPGFKVVEVPLPKFIQSLKLNYHSSSSQKNKSSSNNNYLRKLFDYLRYKKGILNSCRMPDITDFWIRPAFKSIKKKGPWDLVISTAGPYTPHILAKKIKRKKLTKRWIVDYRDTWSNNYIYKGVFPFNKIESYLEKKILQKADAVTTISTPFAESIAKEFNLQKVSVIENGFDPDDLNELPSNPIFFNDGKYRIVHTGSIYQGKRDPIPLFQAIQEMSLDPSTLPLLNKLEVIFAGPQQAALEALIDAHQIGQWVRSVGFVSREDALRMQRDAHDLLFLPWNDPSVDGVLTGKIFEYLFSQTPILAVGGIELEASQNLILEAKAGIVLGSVKEIKDYLVQNLKNVKVVKSYIDATTLKKYTRKSLANRLLKLARQL